ncbi:MAG: hypothetical protein ACYC8T_17210 [Myxococcaceae bacterium]
MAEMVGEGLREIGLLWFAFGTLDGVLRVEPPGWRWFIAIAIISVLSFVGGVAVERWRQP